jgi:hypothetical protein
MVTRRIQGEVRRGNGYRQGKGDPWRKVGEGSAHGMVKSVG